MTTSPFSSPPGSPSGWTPPVIRQVALVMLAFCLGVPAVLVLHKQQAARRDHEPAKTRAAMEALFDAIEPAPREGAASMPDAAALKVLVPGCTKLASHQGLPAMEDMAEQLALVQQQIGQQTAVEGVHNAPLRKHYQLNVTRWAQPILDGKVECQHAAQALRTVAGSRGNALLSQAQWQEHRLRPASAPSSSAAASVAAARLAPGSLTQGDPWRGWPGCIWLGGLQPDSPAYYVSPAGRVSWGKLLCEQDGIKPANAKAVMAAQPAAPGATPAKDEPAWVIPRDLGSLLTELEALRRPEGRLYENYTATLPGGSNRRTVGRNEVDVGFNIHLTIDPRTQATAQQVAECYTGNAAACATTGIDFGKVGAAQGPGAKVMWEQAAARMTAVAVIDVATGRIEALASAHTPCYAQENDGPFRDAACLPLWTRAQRRPDALLNHAVFADYMPGSTVKPIMASVFFEDASSKPDELSAWLARSDTNRFNDELFCFGARRAGKGSLCDRPARVQRRAEELGWNVDCGTEPSFRCASSDILFGRRLSAQLDNDDAASAGLLSNAAPLQRSALAGRLFVSARATPRGNAHHMTALPAFDPRAAESCRSGGKWHANNCSSAQFKPLVNEAEGQGQARTTALGVATMMARLTAAANGQTTLRRPYLVEQLTDAQGRPFATAATRRESDDSKALAQPEALGVKPPVAQAVLGALARGSQPLGKGLGNGTGHLICRHVFGDRCAAAGTRFAGKTGTPSFTFDQRTYGNAAAFCRANPKHEDCFEKPVKWYVAAYKSGAGPQAKYDKAIAVMSERNWFLPGKNAAGGMQGRVHGVNDLNNISAEIGMRVIERQVRMEAR